MKYIDLKEKGLEELMGMLKEKKVALFTLKAKLKTMQVTNTSELRVTKKDIARLQMAIEAKRSEV